MTTRKPRTKVEESEQISAPSALDLAQVPEDDTGYGDEIADLMGMLGDEDGYDISVNALNGRKLEWLFDFTPGELTARELRSHLRDEHGGGEFKIVVRKGGAFVSHKTISIRAKKAPALVIGQTPGAAGQNDRLADVMALLTQTMQQSQQNMQAMIMESQKDSMARQMEMMKLMIESGRGQGQQTDVIGLLSVAKDLFTRKDNSVELLLRGIELSKELSPGNGGDGGLGDVLKTFGAPLVGLMAQQHAVRPVEQISPQVSESDEQQQNLSEVDEMGMIQNIQLQAAANVFLTAAKKGASTDAYAEIFCDQFADKMSDEHLEAFLTNQDEFAKIYELVPETAEYKVWFEELRVKCSGMLFEDV